MEPSQELEHVITFRVSSEERDLLKAAADQAKSSPSKVLREMIRKNKPKRLPKTKKRS